MFCGRCVQSDSPGNRTGAVRTPCSLAAPSEYNWTVRLRRPYQSTLTTCWLFGWYVLSNQRHSRSSVFVLIRWAANFEPAPVCLVYDRPISKIQDARVGSEFRRMHCISAGVLNQGKFPQGSIFGCQGVIDRPRLLEYWSFSRFRWDRPNSNACLAEMSVLYSPTNAELCIAHRGETICPHGTL